MMDDRVGIPESAHEAEPSEESSPASAPAKKKGKKKTIAIAVVAAVIVAGIGFAVWHEQPSFCNAICHTPMDSYLESYTSGDETKNVTVHRRAGLTCLKCHPGKLDQQISEAAHWMSGDYAYDSDTKKLISRSSTYATQQFCLTEGCHSVTTLEGLSAKTANRKWNPHNFTEHGVTSCGDCHKTHGQSVLVCSQCHYQAADDVPDGWTSIPYREAR